MGRESNEPSSAVTVCDVPSLLVHFTVAPTGADRGLGEKRKLEIVASVVAALAGVPGLPRGSGRRSAVRTPPWSGRLGGPPAGPRKNRGGGRAWAEPPPMPRPPVEMSRPV